MRNLAFIALGLLLFVSCTKEDDADNQLPDNFKKVSVAKKSADHLVTILDEEVPL